MAFTLGFAPEKFKVILAAGADFVCLLHRSDDSDWPVGAELSLHFAHAGGSVEWSATLDGSMAEWNFDVVEVDALLALRPRAARLWYVEGDLRMLWALGSVDARG